jgi:hypothetical protein
MSRGNGSQRFDAVRYSLSLNLANKVLQKTRNALASFDILIVSHKVV